MLIINEIRGAQYVIVMVKNQIFSMTLLNFFPPNIYGGVGGVLPKYFIVSGSALFLSFLFFESVESGDI